MAVKTQRGSALPEGAVRLSKDEALEMQRSFINNWPSDLDVFSLKYGQYICASSTVVCGTIISTYFKRFFNVSQSIFTVTYAASVFLPTMGSILMTDRLLTDKVLLMSMTCPICIQLKFTAFQFYNSAICPSVLAFILCHNFGRNSKAIGSYDSPFQGSGSWLNIFKFVKRNPTKFYVIGSIQLGVSFFLPYLQNLQLEKVVKNFEESNYSVE